jgi:hypothetical protein
MSAPAHKPNDAPEVAILLKKARGEALTPAEEAILARTYRRPDGPTVPHDAVMEELAQRQRRGE